MLTAKTVQQIFKYCWCVKGAALAPMQHQFKNHTLCWFYIAPFFCYNNTHQQTHTDIFLSVHFLETSENLESWTTGKMEERLLNLNQMNNIIILHIFHLISDSWAEVHKENEISLDSYLLSYIPDILLKFVKKVFSDSRQTIVFM